MDTLYPALKESAAAGLAVVPCYTFFVKKSAQQTGAPTPTFTFGKAISRGLFEGFPAIAAIVGSQLFIQKELEKRMTPYFDKKSSPLLFPGVSSFLTGAVTSPVLAFYNLLTMKKANDTFLQVAALAVKRLTVPQVGALAVREAAFLYSLRVLDPLEAMVGDLEPLLYFTAFISGYFGGLFCQPVDTAFTLWQRQLSIVDLAKVSSTDTGLEKATKCARVLMQGWKPRALGVGIFVCTYRATNQLLENIGA